MQDQSLHTAITNSFNHLNYLIKKGVKAKQLKPLLIYQNALKLA